MLSSSLAKVSRLNPSLPGGFVNSWAGPLRSPMLGVYLLAGLAALGLPLLYAMILQAYVPDGQFELKHQVHIGLNVLANLICLAGAFQSRGNFESRLRVALGGVVITSGLMLLLIMLLRLYYSRTVLIASVFASIALVTTFNFLIEKSRRCRIGVVPDGLDTSDTLEQVGGGASFVTSPDEPVWAYDVILLDWAMVTNPRWLQFATRAILTGAEVQHIAAFVESRQGRVLSTHFESDHAAYSRSSLYINSYKRVLDVLVVLAVAPVVALITAVAACLIALTMGGPVFFNQQRVGIDGRPFTMYKLRTMRPTPAGTAVSATRVGDARITRLGHFLRRFRIDELPQFYNILIGDMSLVGPRPEQPELARAYARKLPKFNNRTMLRPGITGWAQVRGKYAADENETMHKLAYDLYYLKHVSWSLDMYILLQTIKTLVTGNSAR